jgi:hypothetical protein
VALEVLERWPFLFQALPALLASQPPGEGIRYFSLKDPDPEPSLAWFILNAFLLIGVLLLATTVLGIAFGSFRLWLLEKFPHNRFNGAPRDEVSRAFRLTDDAE